MIAMPLSAVVLSFASLASLPHDGTQEQLRVEKAELHAQTGSHDQDEPTCELRRYSHSRIPVRVCRTAAEIQEARQERATWARFTRSWIGNGMTCGNQGRC